MVAARTWMNGVSMIEFEQLRYDPTDGTLRAEDGETLTLRPQLARLLDVLLEHPGAVIDRETLCRAVWDDDRIVDFEAGLSALVKELRQALRVLGVASEVLETVPRRGYRWHAEPRRSEPAQNSGAPSHAEPPGGAVARRMPWLLTTVAVVAIIVIAASVTFRGSGPSETAAAPRLAVVPFEVLGEAQAANSNLDLILADTLLATLWQTDLEGVILLGRTSMGGDLDGRERAGFVARELQASLILEGSLITGPAGSDEGWRVEARLLWLPRGEVAWTATVSGDAGQAIASGAVAQTLVDDLAQRWPQIVASPSRSD